MVCISSQGVGFTRDQGGVNIYSKGVGIDKRSRWYKYLVKGWVYKRSRRSKYLVKGWGLQEIKEE